ncbi:hypothetical protein EYF80_009604 [Liparis tanakae]|uniref:Uncharacterized protein n=1 Tax=Liparis tanakae TaxID=230148 RepID=A0A4Z2IQN2_9TELE|nr:hypothetical protein EYF80_009604 [Liparis tanakae]
MPAWSSRWQPAVCVTCVSRESRARTRCSCRGPRGPERAVCTDCKLFAKLGYKSLWKHNGKKHCERSAEDYCVQLIRMPAATAHSLKASVAVLRASLGSSSSSPGSVLSRQGRRSFTPREFNWRRGGKE